MRIDSAINLEDFRNLARRALPKIIFDYIDGGTDDEAGLERNRHAFRRHELVPRYLVDVATRDQSASLLGQRFSSPVGIAPTGLARLFRTGADGMLAEAARKADVPFLLSGVSNISIEDAVRIAPDNTWFQLYLTKDDEINRDLVQRARDAGVRALVISVDVPVSANRERNRRNGFSRPFRMTPSVFLDALGHPAWVIRYLRMGGIPMMSNWQPYAPAGATASEVADLFATLTPASMSNWETLEHIRRDWSGPLVVKGLLDPQDVVRAADIGADGVIVSNHGGRQLDAAPAPLTMLPAIREAVGERVELMLDSGIRRGSDIIIARILGARFCFLGRPTLYAVTAGGQQGADRALQIIHHEIDVVLAQLGCPSFDALEASYLRNDAAIGQGTS